MNFTENHRALAAVTATLFSWRSALRASTGTCAETCIQTCPSTCIAVYIEVRRDLCRTQTCRCADLLSNRCRKKHARTKTADTRTTVAAHVYAHTSTCTSMHMSRKKKSMHMPVHVRCKDTKIRKKIREKNSETGLLAYTSPRRAAPCVQTRA